MKRKILIVLVIAVVAIVVGIIAWWLFNTSPTGAKETIVESNGTSTTQFASQLFTKGLVKSPIMFRVEWGWNDTPPQEGYYSLSGTTLEEMVATIRQGPNVTKVTFPEGFSSGQVAQRLGNRDYDADAIYELAQPLEGQLFPETYFFLNDASPQEIVDTMTAQYALQTEGLAVSDEDLIIASIVEREASTDEERPQIAAVYKNRLEIGMDLEADPTVQYGRDLGLINTEGLMNVQLWEPLSSGQVRTVSSAYNTYINGGLPPGPIANPGIKSIEASVSPTPDFDYLFFFHDENGDIRFSKTFAEHQAQIAQYGVSG